MNLLNRLTKKNLILNKKRTIFIIIGIMLSTALLVAVTTVYNSGIQSIINFEKLEKGDYHVGYINVSDSDQKSRILNNKHIEKSSITKSLGFAKIDSKNEYKPYANVVAFDKTALDNLSIRLKKGRLPKNDKEVLITTHLSTNGRVKYKVGDTITLDLGTRVDREGNILDQYYSYYTYDTDSVNDETLINTKTKDYKIVGLVERLDKAIEPYESPGYVFVTYLSDKDIKDTDTISIYNRYDKYGINHAFEILGSVFGIDKLIADQLFNNFNTEERNFSAEELKEAEDKVNTRIEANTYLILLEDDPLFNKDMSGLSKMVMVVLGIVVVSSIYCIKNSFDISISEKIKQYGMLRSVGATKKQIKKNVFKEAYYLGLIGIPIGIILGIFASFILIVICNYLLKDMIMMGLKISFDVSLLAIILSVILSFITIYLSALRSARKAAKISPITAIRNSAEIKINPKKVKTNKFISKLFGIGGVISDKNIKRNKKKYRTTIISIMVSVIIFISLYSFVNLFKTAIEGDLDSSEYNISIKINNFDYKNNQKILNNIKSSDYIDEYSLGRVNGVNIEKVTFKSDYKNYAGHFDENDYYLNIVALDDASFKKYLKDNKLNYDDYKDKLILFNYPEENYFDVKENRSKYKRFEALNYNDGDTLKVITADGSTNIKFDYISKLYPIGYKHNSSPVLFMSNASYNNIFNENAENIEMYAKANNADKLQNIAEEYLGEDTSYRIDNNDEKMRTYDNLLLLISIFLYGFIIVISLIGVTNIFNTITSNIELRKSEFATLKSVGMTNKEFNRMIKLESLFLGLKSLIWGIPISILLSFVMYKLLDGDMITSFTIPFVPIIISVLVVFILIRIIMNYSVKKINKQNIIETIRNENI